MTEKKWKVELTERQWDHVLVALENTISAIGHDTDVFRKHGYARTGKIRCMQRNDEIAKNIAAQLEWTEKPLTSFVWHMTPGDSEP